MALHFGWFIPTAGDTTAYGDPSKSIAPSLDMFVRVANAAQEAGFEYALVPVQTACWEAYMVCAMVVARTERIAALVAARPGFIAPTLLAKMIATFDQLAEGRVRVNLIAGGGAAEMAADGSFAGHDERYAIMDETVQLMKRVWTEKRPVDFHGVHFRVEGASVRPRPFQNPHPPFYLGGDSPAAQEVSAKHADVQLFWGDTPQNIARRRDQLLERADRYGRAEHIKFGMRLQVIVREDEAEAWEFADQLIAGVSQSHKRAIATMWEQSEANRRMQGLAQAPDLRIGEHLWTGITTVRPGAGVTVVGNPQQVADTLAQFVEVGCSEFCLSGYPHDTEATRFGRLVMPLMDRQASGTSSS